MKIISQQILYRKNGSAVETELVVEPGRLRPSGKIYRLHIVGGMVIGIMTTFVDKFFPNFENSIPDQKGSWIEIEILKNYTNDDGEMKIKGVGTLLLRQAFKDSLQSGCNGYIHLDAINNSAFFYYHLGFRPRPDFDKIYRFGPFSEPIYHKLKNNDILDMHEFKKYSYFKKYVAEKYNIDEEELTLEDIFIKTITEEMSDLYENSKKDGTYPNWHSAVQMYLPSVIIDIWKNILK